MLRQQTGFEVLKSEIVKIGECYSQRLKLLGFDFRDEVPMDHPKYAAVFTLRLMRDDAVLKVYADFLEEDADAESAEPNAPGLPFR